MTTRSDQLLLGVTRDGAPRSRSIGRYPAVVWSAAVCFAMLTWAGARIAVPLPFTPVPGTLQTLVVLLAGLFLGARAGAASQMLYLAMGLAGMPVFALPGAGPGYLLGPTGGYLVGFAAAAWLTGWISGRGPAAGRPLRVVIALLAGSAVIHLSGLAWLTLQMGGSVSAAWALAPAPFALFDLTKIVLAATLYFSAVSLGRAIGSPWSPASQR
ncbi:MAG TPA: biotin transporter BioY [Candidatus Polarisedimenticolia bacterium]|nr:biotin transporter BioY [Candidatus Polarisedimenticolia bacterium]